MDVTKFGDAPKVKSRKFIRHSHALYQQFLQPLEEQLQGKERLIIIGDGISHYIPFEILLSSQETLPFQDLEYLIKDYEVSYHYSASLFAKARQKEWSGHKGVFAFAPVYDNQADEEQASTNYSSNLPTENALRAINEDGNFTPLPESEQEVNTIMDLFEKRESGKNTLALRADANEVVLKANLEMPIPICTYRRA